jgi:CheY-like chemotaxis protein
LTGQSVLVLTMQPEGSGRLVEHLRQRGIEAQVVQVDGTPDWLARAIVQPPGAILLDASMAPSQGWQVLKVLKLNPATRDTPVLFCSFTAAGGSVLELDYLTKPIGPAELARALDAHWPADDTARRPRTILVVDDDPRAVAMHARIVQAHSPSHRVLKARDGREALEILQQEPVDLVLLDLLMPEMDGFGVLEAMRAWETTRSTPVLVLTGQTMTEKDMARLNQGVTRVLSKGLFDLDETLAHIDAALGRTRKISDEAQRLVRRAMAYLHEHYADPVSRQELARHVGMDDDYLTACFRKEVGMTPFAYLNRYRISQAKQLLTGTSKNITEIAMEVGFSDSGYFSRVFRREVGTSPEAYRRQ